MKIRLLYKMYIPEKPWLGFALQYNIHTKESKLNSIFRNDVNVRMKNKIKIEVTLLLYFYNIFKCSGILIWQFNDIIDNLRNQYAVDFLYFITIFLPDSFH